MSLTQQISLEQWEALPEPDVGRLECVEGVPVVVPSPQARHQDAVWNIKAALREVVGSELAVSIDVDAVLREDPLTIRRPDVFVREREPEGRWLLAHQVFLVVEVISAGTRRTDRVLKPREYAAAGIGEYWLVDLDLDQPSLTCFVLGPDGAYEQVAVHTGHAVARACEVDVPIDVAALDQP